MDILTENWFVDFVSILDGLNVGPNVLKAGDKVLVRPTLLPLKVGVVISVGADNWFPYRVGDDCYTRNELIKVG